MRFRGLVVHALVLTTFGAATAAQPATTAPSVAFESRRLGEIIVPVSIAGGGPYRFLLDTGSSHSSIMERLATRIGAVAVAQAPVATIAGTQTYPIVRLTDVAAGSAHARELLATVLPASAADALGTNVDGVIGQDFLDRFNYTLDYRKARIVWGDQAERPEATKLVLEPSEGRFLVQLQQDAQCRCQVRFVPDSGADRVVLFDTGRGTRLDVARTSAAFATQSVTGNGSAQLVTLHRLQVGRRTLRDQEAAVVTVDAAGPDRGDGLLPLHFFARVYFNNRDGYVQLE